MVTEVIEELRNPTEIGHFDMRFAKPLDKNALSNIFADYSHVITLEDGCKSGSFGSAILEISNEMNYSGKLTILGIDDVFIEQGTTEELYEITGLDRESVKTRLNSILNAI